MTAPSLIMLLLASGLGGIYCLVRAEPIWHIYYSSGYSGTKPPPPFEEFLTLVALAGILTLIFLVLGFTIVYRCYARRK